MLVGGPNDSFRQVGTAQSGRLQRGVSIGGPKGGASSSIPSKFETTLRTKSEESNGFGARTNRFKNNLNTQPGPGTYHKGTTLVRDAGTCGSVSYRGYTTGFASKASRFDTSKERQESFAPGPGSYARPAPEGPRDWRKSEVTGIFAHRTHGEGTSRGTNALGDATARVPGPGHYDPAAQSNPWQEREALRSNVAFKSNVDRFMKRGSMGAVPAPGAYNVAKSSEALEKQGQRIGGRDVQNAAFRSMVNRNRDFDLRTTTASPGPGAYEAQVASLATVKDLTLEAQPSSMFSNVAQDRFGRAYIRKVAVGISPGPGWYEAGLPPTTAETELPSSQFASRSVRMEDETLRTRQNRAPGPAFYKPENTNIKSFLLNTSSKWI